MTDLTLLRRTILWELLNVELPRITSSHANRFELELAADSAYEKFVFVCEEEEDRENVRAHAEKLLEGMYEPLMLKIVSSVYVNERQFVSEALDNIRLTHPVEPVSTPNPPRSPR